MDMYIVPCLGYCKQGYNKRWSTYIFLNYNFPWIYAQQWDCNAMEYYLSIKKNEIMPFAATWMDRELMK